MTSFLQIFENKKLLFMKNQRELIHGHNIYIYISVNLSLSLYIYIYIISVNLFKKWLGVPNSLTNVALYSLSTKLKLPTLSLVEEY